VRQSKNNLFLDCLALKMKALRCFKMSVTSYQLSCHNIPAVRRTSYGLKGIMLLAAIFLEGLVGTAKNSDEQNLWPETQMQDFTGLV